MAQILNVPLSDDTLTALDRQAQALGTTPAQIAAVSLERQFGRAGALNARDQEAARQSFEAHFGEIDLGQPLGTDNAQIDADLARAYGNDHEST